MEWECEACGNVHDANPSECSDCGHSVLTQYRDSGPDVDFEDMAPARSPEPGSWWDVLFVLSLAAVALLAVGGGAWWLLGMFL